MRKYIPLLPTLIIIVYSVITFFDEGIGSYISAVIINTSVSLYGFWLFFTSAPSFQSNENFNLEITGIKKDLIPIDLSIYRTVIALSIVTAFVLLMVNQWFVVPLFLCWFFWQNLVRDSILTAIKQGS